MGSNSYKRKRAYAIKKNIGSNRRAVISCLLRTLDMLDHLGVHRDLFTLDSIVAYISRHYHPKLGDSNKNKE